MKNLKDSFWLKVQNIRHDCGRELFAMDENIHKNGLHRVYLMIDNKNRRIYKIINEEFISIE